MATGRVPPGAEAKVSAELFSTGLRRVSSVPETVTLSNAVPNSTESFCPVPAAVAD